MNTDTAEVVKRTPEEIAAAATAQAESIRRASWLADVAEWRGLVVGIADGLEPDGDALQRIADLAARLELKPGVLADHVRTIRQERTLTADVAKAVDEGKAAEERMEPLGREIHETRERLVTLQTEADANVLAQQNHVHLGRRLEELRQRHAMLFGPLSEVQEVLS